jgi:hypothetical protein
MLLTATLGKGWQHSSRRCSKQTPTSAAPLHDLLLVLVMQL